MRCRNAHAAPPQRCGGWPALIASVRSNWRWLHVVMGVIFAFGAGWSFALFRGISEIVIAFEVRSRQRG